MSYTYIIHFIAVFSRGNLQVYLCIQVYKLNLCIFFLLQPIINKEQNISKKGKSKMANVFIRTVILYVLLVLLMRLGGKREVGQLELSELVTAFMVSELSSMPITDNSVPLLHGILPTITLLCLEVFLTFLFIKSHLIKKLFSGSPLVVVENGLPKSKALTEARLSIGELMSSIRFEGYTSINQIKYAILEPNGTLSIIPFASERPPSVHELSLNVTDTGLEHMLVCDGKLNKTMMKKHGISAEWIYDQLKKHGNVPLQNVFYLGLDDDGNVNIITKEQTK